jgi:hypothetical protein
LDRIPEFLGESERAAGRAVGATDARRCYDDDEDDRAVVHFGKPIHSGYVLIQRDHLANVTSLEHERWKRAHAEVCRQMGIG